MTRLPTLGPRGEGWVAVQFVLLGVEAIAGITGLGGTVVGADGRLPLAVIGMAAIAAGGYLAGRGLLDLRDALTPLPHPRDGATLVETGVYRLVRHPIYGGLVIAALGFGLVTASPVAIGGAAALLGFFRLKSGLEEVWLSERYPAYAAYRTRTRRMVPLIY